MGVIDKWLFEARGGHGCSNSDYRLHRTTCCGACAVEDVELAEIKAISDVPEARKWAARC